MVMEKIKLKKTKLLKLGRGLIGSHNYASIRTDLIPGPHDVKDLILLHFSALPSPKVTLF